MVGVHRGLAAPILDVNGIARARGLCARLLVFLISARSIGFGGGRFASLSANA
jgi:hypothetical protein